MSDKYDRYLSNEKNYSSYVNVRNNIDDLFESEKYHLVGCLEESESLLDIGCASGGMGKIACNVNPMIDYHGIDIDRRSIEFAKRKVWNKNCYFEVGDFLELELKRTYDLVLMLEIIFFFRHWRNVLARMIEHSNRFVLFTNRVKLYGKTEYDADKSYVPYLSSGMKDAYYVFNISEFIEAICMNPRVLEVDIFGYNIQSIGNKNEVGELGYKLPVVVKDIFVSSFMIKVSNENSTMSPNVSINLKRVET